MVFYVVNNCFDNFSSISCLNHKAYHVKNVGSRPKKFPIWPDPENLSATRVEMYVRYVNIFQSADLRDIPRALRGGDKARPGSEAAHDGLRILVQSLRGQAGLKKG